MEQRTIILDHHPHDSRTDIAEDQQAVQTLTSRMGTGGGNVPMILEPIVLESSQNHATITQSGICPTLTDYGYGGEYTPMIVEVTDTVIPIAVLGGGREHSTICMDETAPTLCTFQDSKPILIARVDNAEIL